MPSSAQQPSAANLRSELQRAGDHLDQITEAYNQARIRRAALDDRLSGARDDVARSEAKLKAERAKMGTAVRQLYMHPVGGIGAFYEAHSFGELQRESVMVGRVAITTGDAILGVRRAKAEQQASSGQLERLRDEARRHEKEMALQRRNAAAALERTQGLLSQAERVLGARFDADRRARLAAASGIAATKIHPAGPVRPGAAQAVRTALAQIGKPYRWGAAGPGSFDCSGLTMYAWASAGVSLPHSSRAQYASLPHVPLSQLAPGDLVFGGSPIHHVSMYVGDGVVVHAPQTGETVRTDSVWGMHPVGAARP